MRRNGTTSAGRQGWRCAGCGASSARRIDKRAKNLDFFSRWLFSKDSIADKKISRSAFWRKTSDIWKIWPIASRTGEICDVVFLDGIWLKREAAVLIARGKEHILSWHLAQSERTEARAALMLRIPEPMMLVSDGSSGLAKAASIVWPNARIRRCAFHAASQVEWHATLRPKLECGQDLLGIANKLKDAKSAESAAVRLVEHSNRCTKRENFLREFTLKDGKRMYTHERLRKARRGLAKLVNDKTLFAFMDMQEEHGGIWDSTNNAIEGGDARIREMLRLHRGLPLIHRIEAIFWWCCMRTENPLPAAEILRVMPADDQVEGLYASASRRGKRHGGGPEEYGAGIVWSEFHMPTEYRQ